MEHPPIGTKHTDAAGNLCPFRFLVRHHKMEKDQKAAEEAEKLEAQRKEQEAANAEKPRLKHSKLNQHRQLKLSQPSKQQTQKRKA